jgi:hypothetical protein
MGYTSKSNGQHNQGTLEMIKIAVVGSRNFKNYEFLQLMLDRCKIVYKNIYLVSSGDFEIAKFVSRWAYKNNCKFKFYQPDFEKYGKNYIIECNKLIIDNCDILLAFWNGRKSRTKEIIKLAKISGKEVHKCWRD